MKTVVAETVLLGKEAFETLGEVTVVPDRQIGAETLKEAELLIVRSKTAVRGELLAGSSIRFAGTATAGFEHLDSAALERQGIRWCAAPGCNADSVADYMTSALLWLHTACGVKLEGKTLGIIGAGEVGSRVAVRAEALGLRVLLNDPPRAAREGSAGFCSLDELLAQSDLVTLHVPLIKDGPWPTRKLAGDSFFSAMMRGATLINASRGEVVDSDALLRAITGGQIGRTLLDVWDPEPRIREDVLQTITAGTPHIAGHSFEGKLNGTIQVYRQACRFLGIVPVWDPTPQLPPVELPLLQIQTAGKNDLEVLAEAALQAYDIRRDFLTPETAGSFDRLRTAYRVRREFKNTRIELTGNRPGLAARLRQAGFTVQIDAPDNG